ncbi:UNVERIFIED_CONTAM: hypothetical protein Scaly_2909500, partial [Sesamum calycinum]
MMRNEIDEPAPQPQPQPQDAVIDKNYLRGKAKVFASTTDPAEAEEWLRNTERVLDRVECTSEQKLRYVVSLFEKDALDWWETIPESKNRPITLTWNDFLKEFADKYTPPVYRNRKVEFLELKKNELSVAGFEGELRLEIQEKIAIKPPSYGALLQAALRAEETSLERSSTEAKQKKLTGNLNPIPGQSGAVSFKGFGLQKGWYRGRGMGQTSRRHTGECWGAQPIVRIVAINQDILLGIALHGEIMPGDLRFQGLVVWGKTRNELVRVEGEVEVVEVAGIFPRHQQNKVVSLNPKQG